MSRDYVALVAGESLLIMFMHECPNIRPQLGPDDPISYVGGCLGFIVYIFDCSVGHETMEWLEPAGESEEALSCYDQSWPGLQTSKVSITLRSS